MLPVVFIMASVIIGLVLNLAVADKNGENNTSDWRGTQQSGMETEGDLILEKRRNCQKSKAVYGHERLKMVYIF